MTFVKMAMTMMVVVMMVVMRAVKEMKIKIKSVLLMMTPPFAKHREL